MKYSTTADVEGVSNVTAIDDGLVMIADRRHPRFKEILAAIKEYTYRGYMFVVPDDQVVAFRNLFDLSRGIEELFQLTPRVTVRGGSLFFDDKRVDDVLSNHVVRGVKDGLDKSAYMPFVHFWERVQANPSEHSRENLLRWLMAAEFTITEEGFIVGYKGVRKDFTSRTAGPGIVNGVETSGHLDNSVGNVVEIERDYVTADPRVHCAQGLHVGTWGYANGFSDIVVEVWVDPADVVSVPNDHNGQKMRVARYEVVGVLEEPYKLSVLQKSTATSVEDDDEDDDFDDDYGYTGCFS